MGVRGSDALRSVAVAGRVLEADSRAGEKFAPKKKWAVSPLLSPPAGRNTANMADKFVCLYRIRRNRGKFNGEAMIGCGMR